MLFAVCQIAHSQILISLLLGDKLNSDGLEFGLEGGYNWSTISEMSGKKSLSKFNLGFYFDIRMKNQLSLYTGVLVKSSLGVDALKPNDLSFLNTNTYASDGSYSQILNYFLVPALLKYKFENSLYIEGGPQAGIMYDAWVEFNSKSDDRDAKIKDYNISHLNRFDLGFVGGLGYKLKKTNGMTLGIKYYYGFFDVYKDRSGTKNESIFVKINIPIGAQKSEKEQ